MHARTLLAGLFLVLFSYLVLAAPTTISHDANGGVSLEARLNVPVSKYGTGNVARTMAGLVEFGGYWENDQNIAFFYRYKDLNFFAALDSNRFDSSFGLSRAQFNSLYETGFPITVFASDINLPASVSARNQMKTVMFPYTRGRDFNISVGGIVTIALVDVNFVLHVPQETVRNGTYDFYGGQIILRHDFTIENKSDFNVFIQEKRLDSFFHNRVASSQVFVQDSNRVIRPIYDTNNDGNTYYITGYESIDQNFYRTIRPWPFLFEGRQQYHTVNVLPQQKKQFYLSYRVEPGSSGKFDLLFRPEPDLSTLDPYWVLDANAEFDPVENQYPTTHRFVRTYLTTDQNLTFNARYDWNSPTLNQILSDQNLVFYVTFDDYNGTHYLDATGNDIDFNHSGDDGFSQFPNYGIRGSTALTTGGDPESLFLLTDRTQKLQNLPAASASFWVRTIVQFNTDANVLESNNDLLDARVQYDGKVYVKWGNSTEMACDVDRPEQYNFFNIPWMNVVVSGSAGQNTQIFVNGIECTNYSGQNTFSSTGTISLLGIHGLASMPQSWAIDDVRFYDRRLSASDANRIFFETALDRNLLMYYNFESAQRLNSSYQYGLAIYNQALQTTGSLPIGQKGVFSSQAFDDNGLIYNGFNVSNTELDTVMDCKLECTVMTWVKPFTSGNTNQFIFVRATGGNFSQGIALIYRPSFPDFLGRVTGAGLTVQTLSSGTGFFDSNKWTHVALVYRKSGDFGSLSFYVNGRLSNTGLGSVLESTGGQTIAALGINQTSNTRLSGYIDEFKYFSRALSESEIVADFNGWKTAQYLSPVLDPSADCSDCNFARMRIRYDGNFAMSDFNVFGRACADATCSANESFVLQMSRPASNTFFDLNNGNGFIGSYFQYKLVLDHNVDFNRSQVDFDKNFFYFWDTNVEYYEAILAPVLVVASPNDSNWMANTQRFDFNVQSTMGAIDVNFDLNLSGVSTQGTGTVLVNDGNVAKTPNLFCDSNDLSTTRTCHYVVDTTAFSDANYFFLVSATSTQGSSFDASDKNFGIDNTAPVLDLVVPDTNVSQTTSSNLIQFTIDERSLVSFAFTLNGVPSAVFNEATHCSGYPVKSCSYTETALVEGQAYLVGIVATDQTGHTSMLSEGFVFGSSTPGFGGGGVPGDQNVFWVSLERRLPSVFVFTVETTLPSQALFSYSARAGDVFFESGNIDVNRRAQKSLDLGVVSDPLNLVVRVCSINYGCREASIAVEPFVPEPQSFWEELQLRELVLPGGVVLNYLESGIVLVLLLAGFWFVFFKR